MSQEREGTAPALQAQTLPTEPTVLQDAREHARAIIEATKMMGCGTITYGTVPPYRDLSTVFNDLWKEGYSQSGFWGMAFGACSPEITHLLLSWEEAFEEMIEKEGMSLMGDVGDGTVIWVHESGCQCFKGDEED